MGIYDAVSISDSVEKALYVYEQIIAIVDSLEELPLRGSHPKELSDLGYLEFRQLLFKPYRIIYSIEKRVVNVLLIADGRRDMRTLLAIRMLRTD